MAGVGFDCERYLNEQTRFILERISKNEGKLYLECGGKLIADYHASRVLPGFDPDVKMRVFQSLKEKIEVIICIYAGDIEHRKIRSDFGITYADNVLKLVDDYTKWGLSCNKIVITRYEHQEMADKFKRRLEQDGLEVWLHRPTKGYPGDVERIVSDEGYGANPYIPTDRPLVLVTAPGPGSGKLATCLSQMYHDYRDGRKSGYAKFETFPVWNLPIDHPVNVAYESATADIGDQNRIDHFHLASYGEATVNYSRDLEAFPLLERILKKITGSSVYKSPTDMGVNRIAFGIVDDEVCRTAARQEIIRRYLHAQSDFVVGMCTKETVDRNLEIMHRCNLAELDRPVVSSAREARERGIVRKKGFGGIVCAAAIQLPDGRIATGCNTPLMHAASSVLLNALKLLGEVDHDTDLISPAIIRNITDLKRNTLSGKGVSINLDEMLICLAMSATVNRFAEKTMALLPQLRDCEMHLTHIPSSGDTAGLRKLGMHVTSDPKFPRTNFYHPL